MELRNTKIAFLGDSITEGHGASSPSHRFTDLIAQKEGIIPLNYGISGTRIARQSQPSEKPKYDLDFPSRVEAMDGDADCIIVFGGTNDYGHGLAPLGTFSDRTAYSFYGALHTLFTSLMEKYLGKPIIIITPLHRKEENLKKADCSAPEGFTTLKTYVEAIREVAEYYSLPILDLYKSSLIQPNIPSLAERFMPDGLHPNDEGYAILADRIISFLKNY